MRLLSALARLSIRQLSTVDSVAISCNSALDAASTKDQPDESARKEMEEEPAFVHAPDVYIVTKFNRTVIKWPSKPDLTAFVHLKCGQGWRQRKSRIYDNALLPIGYALAQALAENVSHLKMHIGNEIIHKVGTRVYEAKTKRRFYKKTIWRALEQPDAPVKIRLIYDPTSEHMVFPKDECDLDSMPELGFELDYEPQLRQLKLSRYYTFYCRSLI